MVHSTLTLPAGKLRARTACERFDAGIVMPISIFTAARERHMLKPQ